MRRRAARSWFISLEQKHKRNHANCADRQQLKRVEIREHCGLAKHGSHQHALRLMRRLGGKNSLLFQRSYRAGHGRDKSGIKWIEMASEKHIVRLLPAGEDRCHDGNADAPAQIAEEIENGRRIVALVARQAGIGRGVDRHEKKCDP